MSPSVWTAKRFARQRSWRPGETLPSADCLRSNWKAWWARKKPTNARNGKRWNSSTRVFTWAAARLSAGKSYMSVRTFVDANVLIYAHDVDSKSKHATAKNILRELWTEQTGVLSMQVLQEFYVNATRKIRSPLPKDSARLVVSSYSIWCIETTPAEVSVAFRIEDESQIGFWDALIVAAAAKSGATRLLSEDLNPGQKIAGLRIENPFAAVR